MRDSIARQLRRLSGKLILKLAHLRNLAWEEHLRAQLGSVESTTVFEYPLRFSHPERVHFGGGVRISWWCRFSTPRSSIPGEPEPQILIGDGTYVGNHTEMVATRKIAIGKNVLLADRVRLVDFSGGRGRETGRGLAPGGEIHIGDGSWLGENVSVVGDVRIGSHCVIGANAVVKRDIPPFSVAVGSPARIIKRYDFATERWEPVGRDGRILASGNGQNTGPAPLAASAQNSPKTKN